MYQQMLIVQIAFGKLKRHQGSPLCLLFLLVFSCALWLGQTQIALAIIEDPIVQKRDVPQSQQQVITSFAPVVEQVVPSVVNVFARHVVKSRSRGLFDDPFFKQFFGDDFGFPDTQRQREQKSLGSGVIVDRAGLVVTNHHVVDGAEELTIILADRRQFVAEVVVADERTDLAVLKLKNPPADLVAIEISDSDEILVGDLVLAIGNPFGVGQTVTSGIISALARTQVGVTDYQSFVQTDAAINPGNSGGALVAMNGHLIGVNTAIFSRSGGSVGIGFAIPSNMVAQVIRAAQKGGQIIRPWLGALFQAVSPDLAPALNLDKPQGAIITQLHPMSPLLIAGMEVGDVIVSVDGVAIETPEEVLYRVATRDIGAEISMSWRRAGKDFTRDVRLIAPPEVPARDSFTFDVDAGANGLFDGLVVANLNPALRDELRLRLQKEGVIVTNVLKRSQASRFGFRVGDIIIKLGDQDIQSVKQLRKEIRTVGPRTTLNILRGDRVLRTQFR